jgi:hypothetical protein
MVESKIACGRSVKCISIECVLNAEAAEADMERDTQPGRVPVHLSRAGQAGVACCEEGSALIRAQRCVGNKFHTVIGRPIKGYVIRLPIFDVLPNQIAGEHWRVVVSGRARFMMANAGRGKVACCQC